MTVLAWFFVAMTPLVLVALFAVALGICAHQSDEQERKLVEDELECKYALPACESRVHTRSGVR